jgi:hypothetical protein
MSEHQRRAFYRGYKTDLTDLARALLGAYEEDWMPEGDEWEAQVQAFADKLDGAIEDRVHEWLKTQERERAERAMAEAMMPR